MDSSNIDSKTKRTGGYLHQIAGEQQRQFVDSLLSWFKKHARKLPWRVHNRTAYRVWVSEVMLQQTRTEMVVKYYLRWMKTLPSIRSVARADETVLLKLWEGLGYYSRVRCLFQAACLIEERYGGRFPKEYNDILSLPGVGPYTAAAISSIVYGGLYAVVDGNVERVLCRYYGLKVPLRTLRKKKTIWKIADHLLPQNKHPGCFNEAMMELGATVCLPQNPLCHVCPIMFGCRAYSVGNASLLPQKADHVQKGIRRYASSWVIAHRSKYLVYCRSQTLMKGLWEFPEIEDHLVCCYKDIHHPDLMSGFVQKYGYGLRSYKKTFEVRHAYTKYRVHRNVFIGTVCMSDFECLSKDKDDANNSTVFRWVCAQELTQIPMSAAGMKICKKLF